MTSEENTTVAPVGISPRVVTAAVQPEFIRLPRVRDRCPYTGLTRSGMNALVLPTPLNGGRPPVRSFVLRRKGSRTGVRLIDFKSLTDYIRAHPQEV